MLGGIDKGERVIKVILIHWRGQVSSIRIVRVLPVAAPENRTAWFFNPKTLKLKVECKSDLKMNSWAVSHNFLPTKAVLHLFHHEDLIVKFLLCWISAFVERRQIRPQVLLEVQSWSVNSCETRWASTTDLIFLEMMYVIFFLCSSTNI